ncbi:PREDICTED: cytochrome P450 302a1, mitochondrial-like [Habropoda laboriosa]|uniref:cytochrome P450 302a1, mitochondrial-like n=1 Tax=Habropoda laboriosa TaxID=597456 RepID=UPI00083E20E0|nr:PREDICTED: cytochrome P450 302a1, mitochondrial-like [Habropoda laboriosa]
MLTLFFDLKGTVQHEYAPEGQTVNKEYYLEVLKRLHESLRKCSEPLTRKKLYIKFYSDKFAKCKIETNEVQPKPFSDIPGPKSLPVIGTLYKYLPLIVINVLIYNKRLNSFSKEERCENSTSSKLIDAAFTTNSAILKLDNGLQLWRFFETPLYRKLRKAQMYMEAVALELVSSKRKDMEVQYSKSFLNSYLENSALDIKDVVGMACDMLLAGIDTTTYSTAFTLYHLAKNQDIQEKLRSEAMQLLDHHNQQITVEVLRNASYTKAVIKESLRLNPISIGVGRILQTDVILNGYQVPKGTVVVTQNQIICRLSEYFNEPDSFIPERWLRDNSDNSNKINSGKSIHPYVLLPFGHGPRSCIARRFAEQNMQVLLLRICQRFKFSWHGNELGMVSLLINKPDAPLKFNFHEILKARPNFQNCNDI